MQFALESLLGAMAVAPDDNVIEAMFAEPSMGNALDEYADLLERNEVKSDVERAKELRLALVEANLARRFDLVWPVLMTGPVMADLSQAVLPSVPRSMVPRAAISMWA